VIREKQAIPSADYPMLIRDFSGFRKWEYVSVFDFKMVCPAIFSWMKKGNDLTRIRDYGCDITSFVFVAKGAGKRKVVSFCLSLMLLEAHGSATALSFSCEL
jgi:hypothetical protein